MTSGGGGVTRVRGSVVNLESSNLQIKTNVLVGFRRYRPTGGGSNMKS